VRYAALNEAFKALIELLSAEPPSDSTSAAIVPAARDFLAGMQMAAGHGAGQADPGVMESRIGRLAALVKSRPRFRDARAIRDRLFRILGSVDDSRLLSAWMAMYAKEPGDFERFGLDCTLRRMLRADGARHRIRLLFALLALPETSVTQADIFSAPACREFLDVHESRGTEWFNKERFEELGEWLAILDLLNSDTRAAAAGALSTAMARAENERHYALSVAEQAGFRTGLYRRIVAKNSIQTPDV
jgi:hypothetical protein